MVKGIWSKALADLNMHSWEEVLEPGERIGGPTPYGSSFWTDFKRCPYYFDFTHNKRWRRVEYNENLEVGGLTHEAIGRYYAMGITLLEAHSKFTPEDDAACLNEAHSLIDRAEKVVPVTASIARRLVKARFALYGPGKPKDDRRDTYGVEVYLGIDEPFPLTTRIDRWCWSDQLKGAVIHELKTAKQRDGRLLASYRMDFQFLIQQYLWKKVMNRRRLPLKAYGVDLITKTQQPDVIFEAVPVDPKMLKDFEKEMRWTHLQWQQCRALNHWPKNRGYRCRFCELFDHCASGGKSTQGWRKKKKGEH